MRCSIASRGRAQLANARALILRMHTLSLSRWMSSRAVSRAGAACDAVRMRTCAARVCAQGGTRYCKSAARCQNEILEHASPVLCSGLGKISQTGDLGIVTRPDARAVSSLMARFVQVSLSLLHLANCPALYRNCHFYKRLQNELGNRQTRAC